MEASSNSTIQGQATLSIKESKCISFELTEYGGKVKEQIPLGKYEYTFTLGTNLNIPEKEFRHTLEIKLFEVKDTSIKILLGQLKSVIVFQIFNFEDVVKKNGVHPDDLIDIPSELMAQLIGIVVSTTRGMFSVKFGDTIFSNAILPLIDVKILLPNPGPVITQRK